VIAGERARFARRRWLARLGRWRLVLLAVAAAGAVGAVGWLFWSSDLLAVDRVSVQGTSVLTDAEVAQAAGVNLGTPLARVDLDQAEARVSELAAVADAAVVRDWPGTLRIEVSEREPVAVVAAGGRFRALDREGVLFRRYARPPIRLPLVQGGALDASTLPDGAARADAMREVASVVVALDPAVAARVDHVEVASLDAIELVLRSGERVRWGSAEESAFKARVLAALMRMPAAVYDVSVPGFPTTSGTAAR
jgi:cell division protein FtsQ